MSLVYLPPSLPSSLTQRLQSILAHLAPYPQNPSIVAYEHLITIHISSPSSLSSKPIEAHEHLIKALGEKRKF